MILVLIVAIPIIGGLAAWPAGRRNPARARLIVALALGIDLVLVALLGLGRSGSVSSAAGAAWMAEVKADWVPRFGISFHLAVDGLSLLLVGLTMFLGLLAVLASWTEVKERVGFFHFNLLWVLAGIAGVFLAVDLFLFYFFWELMLVPMYFLIAIWGHERRVPAAYKFFLFTQASGLAMLAAILALYFVHGHASGVYTFEYSALMGTSLEGSTGTWIMLGFALAFLVKMAVVPLHTWLPDAHSQAPTAGSVVLAGLLLKTGAYGLLRFVVPFFPDRVRLLAPIGMALGLASIIYGAVLAFSQKDLKRLVAYTSVSHMGFIMLGVFSLNTLALQGVVMQMLCHGLSTGALFILAGALQERVHTRDMERMGGLLGDIPRLGSAALLFALASLGLPGFGNFVAEFLILLGSFARAPVITVLASLGFVASVVYALSLIQRVFHGERKRDWAVPDLNARELVVIALMAAMLIGLGFYPQPVLDIAGRAVETIQRTAGQALSGQGYQAGSLKAMAHSTSARAAVQPNGKTSGPEPLDHSHPGLRNSPRLFRPDIDAVEKRSARGSLP